MTTFRVWAPDAAQVALHDGETDRELARRSGGWWQLAAPDLKHGADYAFRIDAGDPRPDPRSLWQPNGVHAASRVYDHDRYEWHDGSWRGVPLAGSVLYELHVGTFTEEGTLSSALTRLDHLVELGVDAVELLPLAAFDGPRGWGYDGVALYAVHEPYGGPDALKGFVDACHDRGIGVVLDVVYNHLGPSGNYLAEFGPYFTDRHTTPWGSAVNLDAPGSDEVRAWIIDNAIGWLRDFHLDGLRLDAVHALRRHPRVPAARGAGRTGARARRAGRQAAVPRGGERPQRPADRVSPAGRRSGSTRSGATTSTTRCTRR